MRKDCFKNEIQADMTANDINCNHVYRPRWRGKAKRLLRRAARQRIKRDI